MIIGSHVAMKAPKMLAGSAKEAHSYEANAMMIFTGAPQNTRRKDISEMNIEEGQRLLKLYGIRERAIKRARDLEALLNIRKEQDVELEFNILVRKIHKLDNEIFEAERKLQR